MRAVIEQLLTPAEASFHYLVRTDSSFGFQWHFHPEFELTLIVSSEGRRFVGDHIADYRSGDLVLLGPNLPHTWRSEGGGRKHRAIVIQFRRDFLGSVFFDRPELAGVVKLFGESSRGIVFAGPARAEAAERMQRMNDLVGMPRLLELLAILNLLAESKDASTLASAGFAPMLDERNHRRIDKVCAYIMKNEQSRISQSQAAAIAHLSPAPFSRFFRRATGKSFVQYVNELRIGRACRLLIETDKPITAIAHDAGFENLSNFNRQFEKLKGMPPREFRKGHL